MARRVLTLAVLAALAATAAAARLKVKREELTRIRGELTRTLVELKELKDAEESLGTDVRGLESRDERSRHRLATLQADIRRAESRRGELKNRLDAARSVAGFWAAAIASEAARRTAAQAARSSAYGTRELWVEEFRRAAIIEKARHLRGLHGFRRQTERAEADTGRRARELGESRHRAQAERAAGRQEYEQKKIALERTQERLAVAQRRARELEESARALTAFLDKLGRVGRSRAPQAPARLDLPRHSLPWPAAGRVLRPFGRERDPELGAWTVRQGTLFSSAPGASVGAVASGRVIFAGSFRSYGRVVIVDHGSDFFSVYGELGELAKSKGEGVRAGETLARAGAAGSDMSGGARGSAERLPPGADGGQVYLELRRGTEALDPMDWLERK